MADLFKLSEPQPFDEECAAGDYDCQCPNPDDQYLLEIDNGSVFLVHRACGKQPRGDYLGLVEMGRIPVTIKAEPYGNCDGSEWHGEYRCDCGVALVATVNGLAVVHDNVPYLVGRDYRDRDGAVWRITSDRDRQERPLVFLLPQGAGEDCPLEEIVTDFGPLELVTPE
ncbi:phiSA1p31-related protein [Streptomyces sp. NBC_01238]|uniref:phiSA1p31-related protein n=1 Tax=Streptomyces sp. NBC_01238 TaxID=2903791 RepID=UPI002F91B25C